jgi:hypothetical protein
LKNLKILTIGILLVCTAGMGCTKEPITPVDIEFAKYTAHFDTLSKCDLKQEYSNETLVDKASFEEWLESDEIEEGFKLFFDMQERIQGVDNTLENYFSKAMDRLITEMVSVYDLQDSGINWNDKNCINGFVTAISVSTHSYIDHTLHEYEKYVEGSEAISSILDMIFKDLRERKKRKREIEREIMWKRSLLPAESGNGKKRLLENEIIDMTKEAKDIETFAEKADRLIKSYTWKIDVLAQSRKQVVERQSILKTLHDLYLNTMEELADIAYVSTGKRKHISQEIRKFLKATVYTVYGRTSTLTEDNQKKVFRIKKRLDEEEQQ